MPDIYEKKNEFGGYSVRKSEKGFVVEHWSSRQGELTDEKVFVPYRVAGYNKDCDLQASHNATMTVGDYVGHVAMSSAPEFYHGNRIRILRKGHLVQ